MRAHLATLRSLPASVADPAEAVAAFRPLAPHAPEAELWRWIRAGLVEGEGGRWTWRSDPSFRRPGPSNRLVTPVPVLRLRLASVTCPLLLVVGAESWMVEPTAQMATVTSQVEMVTVPLAGHWILLDNPDGFLATVDGFLTEGA
jgi:pimeloyl-ACP methyl ester carboxylesterase